MVWWRLVTPGTGRFSPERGGRMLMVNSTGGRSDCFYHPRTPNVATLPGLAVTPYAAEPNADSFDEFPRIAGLPHAAPMETRWWWTV